MIENRIKKNISRVKSYIKQHEIECYRIYDRDIPEYPYIIDIYKDHAVVYERANMAIDTEDKITTQLEEIIIALKNLFDIPEEKVIVKIRERQRGPVQYRKFARTGNRFTIREGKAEYFVNLWDYLDTGLFLDHRSLRFKFQKTDLKGKTFLNLFCYTGAVSVAAALSGAHVTSVDMSNTYLEWAQDNFELNKLSMRKNRFIQNDCIEFLKAHPESYDVIFLDPPTFSNSKRMEEEFSVERDHEFLIDSCMSLLKPDGVLYFSNNCRGFKLNPTIPENYKVKNITEATIPTDFRDLKIHVAFEIRH